MTAAPREHDRKFRDRPARNAVLDLAHVDL